jgi:hypothetical protein
MQIPAVAALFAVAQLWAGVARAQVRVDWLVGAQLSDFRVADTASTVDRGSAVTQLQQSSGFPLAGGVRVTFPVTARLDLDATVASGSADLVISDSTATTFTSSSGLDGRIVFTSAKLVAALTRRDAKVAWSVGAGPAYIFRIGEAYRGLDGFSGLGGVVAVGATVRIAGRRRLSVTIEDHLYSMHMRTPAADFGSRLRNDLLIAVGITMFEGR